MLFDFTLSNWIKKPPGNNFFSKHLVFAFLILPFLIGIKSQRETTCFQDRLFLLFEFILSDWIKTPKGNTFSRHVVVAFDFALSNWIKKPKGDTFSRHLVFVF